MAHYRPAVLHTDDAGARLLVDGVGLEFDEVHTTINALRDEDPGWWALGKLHTYREQSAPFVHVDSDVFLWKALDPVVASAPVFAQNPEGIEPGRSFYRPDVLEAAVAGVAGGWLPPEWRWYRASGLAPRAESCGILGANRLDFVHHYADQAIHFVQHPGNQAACARIDKITHTVLIEQFLLAACLEYHGRHDDSPFPDVGVAYVFESAGQAFDPARAADAGYTHLIADSKRHPQVAADLEARVATDYPESYERCVRYLARNGPALAGLP
ncbi:MAG: hypothetical protein QOK39_704 [Acidimicrobiaceae bacterium]|jgi:hypothetical protein|nr:hypothetical protein [Acidimicrobiaceae bacterium]